MAFLKAYINTFINQRKKNFEMHFLTSFPLLSLTYNHHAPFCCDYCIGSRFFFPFLGLVTTAASHSSNNLFAYHKMHWRILPAFSIWPLPSHFPCTSTQCITTSTLVSLCLHQNSKHQVLAHSHQCNFKRMCPRLYYLLSYLHLWDHFYDTIKMHFGQQTLSLSLSLLISSWAKE